MAAGYSGTPLLKKLGITASTRLVVLEPPPELPSLYGPLPEGTQRQPAVTASTTLVHLFVAQRDTLAQALAELRASLQPDAAVWVSWPKKASKVPTTVTEDVIRELALPLGYVDIKVCAVSEVWSGLKLVVRQALRGSAAG
ncbi:DUF3052 domain-containing protein [Ideonella alba]|uniref:DUF3052 domain-containing protein n=1 Tax=Ideonella alba TaxID=2824118 RepID=UPI001FFC7E99|nr:DUF3052 domain-containing protein [Ideonella alba]